MTNRVTHLSCLADLPSASVIGGIAGPIGGLFGPTRGRGLAEKTVDAIVRNERVLRTMANTDQPIQATEQGPAQVGDALKASHGFQHVRSIFKGAR